MRHRGGPAALKLYHEDGLSGEGPGLAYLAAMKGQGAVRLLARAERAVLLEWADGPALGDLARAGDLGAADERLAALGARLLAHGAGPEGLAPLGVYTEALRTRAILPGCPAPARRDMEAARARLEALLASAPAPRALHGDLHHDNIHASARADLALDPKGVWGDPGYEFANALRNPRGCKERLRAPALFRSRLARFAAAAGVPPARLAHWAFVKVALSIAWRGKGGIGTDDEFDLLALFGQIAGEMPLPERR